MDATENEARDLLLNRIHHHRLRAHRMARAHFLTSKRSVRLHYRLGIPLVVITTIVGTTVFASLKSSPNSYVVIIVGLLSMLSSVIAALQTFFGYAEKAETHRSAGAVLGAVERRFDLLDISVRTGGQTSEQALAAFSELVESLSLTLTELPDVPDACYDQARREQEEDTI